jgi:hypothetical protein
MRHRHRAESDKVMPKQYVAVPLLEGVHSSVESLTLRHVVAIDGIECRVLLPGPHPVWGTLTTGP